jgi:hypothetical protein
MMTRRPPAPAEDDGEVEYKLQENEIWNSALERPVQKKDISSLLARLPWLAESPLRKKAESMDGSGAAEAAQLEAGHMLRLAAIKGDVDGVRAALDDGADVDDVDTLEGNTAVYEAARKGHPMAVQVLTDANADLEKPNKLGLLPMQEAVRAGHSDVVRVLMRGGVATQDVAHGGSNSTDALLEAATWGHTATVEALLEDPFQNPDIENTLGETPVFQAARAGHAEVVRALAHGGANVNHRAFNGSTALMIGAAENRYDVVRYLVEHRAQVNDADERGSTALLYASRRSKCTCKHNRVARKSRGSMDEQLHKFNSCTCSRATYKLLQSAAKDQAGAIFTENGAAVDTVKRQRQLDDQHEQSRALRPGSPARSASAPPHSGGLLQLADRSSRGGTSRGSPGGSSRLPAISWTDRQSMLEEQKKDGESMYESMGANKAGDDDFQRAKKQVFIQCYGAPPRPPTREIPKPWVCTLCAVGKQPAFENRDELKDHEVERHPFECPIDGKRFDTAEDRRIHMRRCHKPDGFVMDMALEERENKSIPGAWKSALDRMDQREFAGLEEVRKALMLALGTKKKAGEELDPAEIDLVQTHLRRMQVEDEVTMPLRMNLAEADTSKQQQQLMKKFCPTDIAQQKAELTELLITYGGHLRLLHGAATKNPSLGMTLDDLLGLLEQMNLLDSSRGFGKPQVQVLFKQANSARLADYLAHGTERIQEKARAARQKANEAAMYAERGSFASDVGQRAAKHQASQAEVVAQEAEAYVRSVLAGREEVQGLPNTLTADELIAVLMRVPTMRFGNIIDVHEAFLWFIKAHLLEHPATRIVDDYMMSDIREQEVQSLIAKQRTELRQVHDQYGERVGGNVLMSLNSWLGMLTTTKLLGKDDRTGEDKPKTKMKVLTRREARFQFLSVQSPDSAVTVDQPPVGVKPSNMLHIGFDGFVQCVARLARELTYEDLIVVPFVTAFQSYLLEYFLPKAAGMKFFELKKTALMFKRKTKKAATAKSGAIPVTKLLGADIESLLQEQSLVRTTVFSAIANYPLEDTSQTVLIEHLKKMGVAPDVVSRVESAMIDGEHLQSDDKEMLKLYTVDLSPEQEMQAILSTLDKHTAPLTDIFVYYGTDFTLDMKRPLGFLDANGFLELLIELGIVGRPKQTKDEKKGFGVRASVVAALAQQSAASQQETARTLAAQLLDITKAQRLAENLGTDAVNDSSNAASNRWIWPEDAFKTRPPDFLTFDEFKRLLVRLAYDKYAHVRGVTNRLNQLIFNSFSQHLALDVDTIDAVEKIQRPDVQKILNLHKSTLKKIFSNVCKWDMNRFDMAKFMIFCQACKLGDLVRQTRFLLFCARIRASVQTVEEVFWVCIALICIDDMKRNDLKFKPGKGGKGGKPAGEPAKSASKSKSRDGFEKTFESWLTARLLYLAWDWKKVQAAMNSKKKTSEVSLSTAWKRKRDPAVVAKEEAEKAATEARFAKMNKDASAIY